MAFALYKPAAAIIYAVAFKLGGQQGALALLDGVMMLILAILALPALLRFLVPATSALAAGGGTGVMLAGAAGAAAMRMPSGAAQLQSASQHFLPAGAGSIDQRHGRRISRWPQARRRLGSGRRARRGRPGAAGSASARPAGLTRRAGAGRTGRQRAARRAAKQRRAAAAAAGGGAGAAAALGAQQVAKGATAARDAADSAVSGEDKPSGGNDAGPSGSDGTST